MHDGDGEENEEEEDTIEDGKSALRRSNVMEILTTVWFSVDVRVCTSYIICPSFGKTIIMWTVLTYMIKISVK